MNIIYYLIALSIGIAIAAQSAVNNQLKSLLGGSTFLAALVSFSVGALSLCLICIVSGERFTQLTQLRNINPWLLSGGVMGAFFVFGTTLLAPRLGVASMISLVILGQVVMALIMDKFGLLGLPIRDILPVRLVGIALVMAGAICVNLGGN
ncbi:DMT family transporter [Rosenbergiella epipactidis]|uniref:DMT family transporter n=1 Tax=Rosenbergiella epipactidis TaxID=1544694 RepID=UPI001F4E0E87|nr:DMT family transporter [Rosenbergiella epipactidis]